MVEEKMIHYLLKKQKQTLEEKDCKSRRKKNTFMRIKLLKCTEKNQISKKQEYKCKFPRKKRL